MIPDNETNHMYFSRLITVCDEYCAFWHRLEKLLLHESIPYSFIDGTRDIWCRDYMPVQVSKTRYVRFRYKPSYCDNSKWRHTITNQEVILINHEIESIDSGLIVDGGNIVKSNNRIIMTDRIMKDNPAYSREQIISECKRLLEVDNVHIIPSMSYDYTGHADGMVRFFDDSTLIVADYSHESASWRKKFSIALKSTGLEIVPFPAVISDKRNKDGDLTAIGCYINFARIGNTILLPQFGIPEDIIALEETQKLFPGCTVVPVLSCEIAYNGGVLNCITWSIFA